MMELSVETDIWCIMLGNERLKICTRMTLVVINQVQIWWG